MRAWRFRCRGQDAKALCGQIKAEWRSSAGVVPLTRVDFGGERVPADQELQVAKRFGNFFARGASQHWKANFERSLTERRRLPICECGIRVYCGEDCQAQDWAAGHSTLHAVFAACLGDDDFDEATRLLRIKKALLGLSM